MRHSSQLLDAPQVGIDLVLIAQRKRGGYHPVAMAGGRNRVARGLPTRSGPGRKIINVLFFKGCVREFRIFKWVRVEGLQWYR
jgi:hypothetical protein